jgi:putative peptide zinc metalloprotease protein
MNITEALNVALPEIPARTVAQRYPRIDPDLTFQEHVEEGNPVVRVYLPSENTMFRFPRANWPLIQLFDGKRSYAEIADIHSANTGAEYSEDEVRQYADELAGENFWYRTPQEKNILALQKNSEERQKKLKAKSRYGDISLILFPAFNPDKFLTWFYSKTSYFYTPWFTVLTLLVFTFMGYVTVTRWSEIGRDTFEFYNFAHKGWNDVVLFYVLAIVVLACHEFGHAHACKHYGGRVPAMGFALIYLTPAFYTDTTEGHVKASRYQRLIISVAGVWAELMICAVATPIWWGTPPDTFLHIVAYDVILITGISSALINWNPLMKLDGYHMLCEIIGIADLKEASTLYVSSWLKKHLWRLPVEVPYVRKRYRFFFVMYALLSGVYSYSILYLVAGFVGNVASNVSVTWAFVPKLLAVALIFRSRIRTLVNFMKFVYLDKKDRVIAWFTPQRSAALAVVAAISLLVPVVRDSVSGKFLLEPAHSAEIRALTAGTVTAVYAHEGSVVAAGAPLMEMRNVPLQSKVALSNASYEVASAKANSAVLHFQNFGALQRERDLMKTQNAGYTAQAASLNVTSPVSGTVVTPRIEDQLGSYVKEGTPLAEVADLSLMRARIYVSEYDMSKFRIGTNARIEVAGAFRKWNSEVVGISMSSSEIHPSLAEREQYKGLNPPHFYVVDLRVPNDNGQLKPGMAGLARLYGKRISLAELLWRGVRDFYGRKIW